MTTKNINKTTDKTINVELDTITDTDSNDSDNTKMVN